MAISIDRVYQKVLAFANKEQRGYITPQEFNLFADQAQMEIFEQYFYDINQWSRQHGNDTGHSDMLDILEDKITPFDFVPIHPNTVFANAFGDIPLSQFDDLYRLTEIRVNYTAHHGLGWVTCDIQNPREFLLYQKSPLTRYAEKTPVALYHNLSPTQNASRRIKVYPYPPQFGNITNAYMTDGDNVKTSYIRKPTTPSWGYVVVNDKALYNSTSSTDFELHTSEESELVYRILAFAGISIEKPNLTQAAAGFEQAKVQQEKQ